jgi:hypothetical protein
VEAVQAGAAPEGALGSVPASGPGPVSGLGREAESAAEREPVPEADLAKAPGSAARVAAPEQVPEAAQTRMIAAPPRPADRRRLR